MKLISSILVAAAVLSSTYLAAQDAAPSCVPVEKIAAPAGWRILEPLNERETAVAVEIFESMTGVEEDFNLIILAEHIDGRGIMLLGKDGMICGSINIEKDRWQAVKRGIVGFRA